jgi:hypothetical protein
MGQRTIEVAVSSELAPTIADTLKTDCLRIETVKKIQLAPHSDTRINLTVHNTSHVGRMGQIIANFDAREAHVKIPNSHVYVAPDGQTVVYAIVSPLLKHGNTKITFDVF